MEYTVIINGRSYELPKKTLAVMEKLDDVLKVDSIQGMSIRQKYEKLHTFVKDIFGEEKIAEVLGSNKLDDIDTSELSLIVIKINESYEKPLTDYKQEMTMRKFNGLPIEKMNALANGAKAVSNMQSVGR